MATLGERVRHVVQSSFDGRRIVIFSGGADQGERRGDLRRVPRHPRRRRLRLDHRAQLVPAAARSRAPVPRHRDEDLLGREEVAGPAGLVPAPSESEVRGYLKTLSNWGRWGSEDELGTINFITPAKRQAAARLVSHGESVTCARPITTDITARHHRPAHALHGGLGGRARHRLPGARAPAPGRGRVHRHGVPRLHDHPRRRALALLLGRPALQRALVQRGDLARGRHRQLGRGAPRRGGEPGRAAGRRADQGRALARGRGGCHARGPGGGREGGRRAGRGGRHPARAHRLLRAAARGGAGATRCRPGPRRCTRPAAPGCGSVGSR